MYKVKYLDGTIEMMRKKVRTVEKGELNERSAQLLQQMYVSVLYRLVGSTSHIYMQTSAA